MSLFKKGTIVLSVVFFCVAMFLIHKRLDGKEARKATREAFQEGFFNMLKHQTRELLRLLVLLLLMVLLYGTLLFVWSIIAPPGGFG